MKGVLKDCAVIVGAVMGFALSYIGALTIIAHYMNGDERSLFIAILPAVVVAWLICERGEE